MEECEEFEVGLPELSPAQLRTGMMIGIGLLAGTFLFDKFIAPILDRKRARFKKKMERKWKMPISESLLCYFERELEVIENHKRLNIYIDNYFKRKENNG